MAKKPESRPRPKPPRPTYINPDLWSSLRAVTGLAEDQHNARRHGDRNLEAIAASLAAYGQQKPIVVANDGRTVVAGNGTLRCARTLGWEWIACVAFDGTPDEARAFGIADNRAAELAEWDDAELASALQSLDDLGPVGFTDDEARDLLASIGEGDENREGIDEVPEPPTTARTKPGDVWLLDDHRVMCGDSTDVTSVERAMVGALADVIFSDPPYNVAYQDNESKESLRARNRRTDGLVVANDAMSDADFDAFLDAALAGWPLRAGGVYYLCAPPGRTETQFRLALERAGTLALRQCIVWVKDQFVFGRQDYHWRHESILYGWRSGAAHSALKDRTQDTVWEVDRPKASAEHPTMKPVALATRAITNSSRATGLVFDGFLGSGSTLMAAEASGRRCVGMEIEPRYVDIAVARWEKHTGRKATREKRGRTK